MPLEHNPVGWFEIPVIDFAQAKAFYEHVFEIKLEEHHMGSLQTAWFPMQPEAIGASGTLVRGEGYVPSPSGVLVFFTASDIDATLARAEEKGGKTLIRKTNIGEYGCIDLLLDCEGNRIGLHSTT